MKILVTDLDGTFLEKNGSLPSNASLFMNFLKKKEFIIIFATARPIGDLNKYLLKYIKPDWIICNDGAIAFSFIDGKQTITIENNLNNKIVKDNANFITSKGIYPLFFMGSKHNFKVYIPSSMTLEDEIHIKQSDTTREINRYKDIETIIQLGSIRSVSLYGNIDEKLTEHIKSANEKKANIMYYNETRFDGRTWLDIISLKAEKSLVAHSIARIEGSLKINIALGNGQNDLSLISTAEWSSCPNSAIEEIKKNVSYVSNENEGEFFLKEVMKQMEVL